MAAERAPFVDQSQSMNIFIEKPDFIKLNSCLFYAWKCGLKTGIYYLRSKSASEADNFGIDINTKKKLKKQKSKEDEQIKECKLVPKSMRKEGEDCLICGS